MNKKVFPLLKLIGGINIISFQVTDALLRCNTCMNVLRHNYGNVDT